ncbi:MAG: acyl-CoA synthase [Micromonosporaceae bacterium]|nr:acyl-CoA synthase [Micromonosporaceae bacterium]
MTDYDLSDIASIEPAEFTRLVKSTPDAQLAEVMAGEHRAGILAEIFGRFPKQFRADRAGSTSAVIHWGIAGGAGGGSDTYQVVIENGTCTTSSTADRDPRLTLSLGAVDFLKVVSGAGNPVMMFMSGKLKAKGDLALAANIANLFDLPKG